ncbi:hypothetical protein ACFW9M_04635 [Streptomyces lydicus]|uniref:hypothetical protein n=1 Tax=Streptomyces lydicus TaxID=47763 RepID=UPI0036CD3335
MTTLLEVITAAVHGDERLMVREDARQVILAARECLDGGDAELYASCHVPAVQAVITNLLPTCTGRARQSSLTMTAVDHARALLDGTHVSQSYPARRRLRILLYSAHRLLVLSQPTPRRRLRRRRRHLAPPGPGGRPAAARNQTGTPTPGCPALPADPPHPALKRVGR